MPYDPARHHRRSVRLPGYSYAEPGWYSITICVKDRVCCLGEVGDQNVRLTQSGRVVRASWLYLPALFPSVCLDAFVVMPNHVHGVIGITEWPDQSRPLNERRGLIDQTPTDQASDYDPAPRLGWILMNDPDMLLAKVVRAFKARATLEIRRSCMVNFAWQRNCWERVSRSVRELIAARSSIEQNPERWCWDRLNPERPSP